MFPSASQTIRFVSEAHRILRRMFAGVSLEKEKTEKPSQLLINPQSSAGPAAEDQIFGCFAAWSSSLKIFGQRFFFGFFPPVTLLKSASAVSVGGGAAAVAKRFASGAAAEQMA